LLLLFPAAGEKIKGQRVGMTSDEIHGFSRRPIGKYRQ
jgi:hypothetical protein